MLSFNNLIDLSFEENTLLEYVVTWVFQDVLGH